MDTSRAILLTNPILKGFEPRLTPLAAVLRLWEQPDAMAFARSPEGARVAAIVTDGGSPLDPDLVDAFPQLGLLASVGAGYDGIHVDRARARGVEVTNSPQVNNEDVADMALALVLAAVRGLIDNHRRVVDGLWTEETRAPLRRSMRGLKVGIIGLGAIGEATARRLDACLSEVRWWGPRPKPDAGWPRMDTLDALADWAEVLVVTVKASEETRGLVSAEVLAALGARGVLVNVARGSVVDETALLTALAEGRLAHAALDVFAQEPTPAERWRELRNVTVQPHVGGSTDYAIGAMLALVVDNVRLFLAGEPVRTPVPTEG